MAGDQKCGTGAHGGKGAAVKGGGAADIGTGGAFDVVEVVQVAETV